MDNSIEQFKQAMHKRGLVPPQDLLMDGKIHRCDAKGEKGKSDGSYLIYPDFPQAGGFENWRDGKGWEKWSPKAKQSFSPSEKEAQNKRLEAVRREQEAERKKRAAEAKEKAAQIWEKAVPCIEHPYLKRKGIKPHGIRMQGWTMLIPLRNDKGEIQGLQSIDQEGVKKFLPGTQKTGNYFLMGKPDQVLCIAEGFATAASIYEATGHATAVAFDCGNLSSVASALRYSFSNLKIVICADDDWKTLNNPGRAKGAEAAQSIGGYLAFPDFGENRPNDATDFNDLYRIKGAEAVQACLEKASSPSEVFPEENLSNNFSTTVELIQGSTIKPEMVEWIWPGWLATGKMHILGGVPGTGKTTLGLSLASTISLGGYWPDGSSSPKGKVVIWSGEDDPNDTLTPRLIASGADMSRVFFIGGVEVREGKRPFDPAQDVPALCRQLSRIEDVKLIIIDPIVSAIMGDDHKNSQVRRSLQPLVDLAASMKCALLGITHFTKGTAGREPLERITGSLAFGALARIVLVASKFNETKENTKIISRILLRAKSNLGEDHGGFRYDLHQREVQGYPGFFASTVLWGENIQGTAREILNEAENLNGDEKESVLEDAKDFLLDLLANGPLPQKTVRDEAEGAGISRSSLLRAKTALKISSKKTGMNGGWEWYCPRRYSNNPEDPQPKVMSTLGNLEYLRQPEGSKMTRNLTAMDQEHFEERAALLEFDGGFSRKEAERLAMS